MTSFVAGRHFLQTPGPTNVPDRVLRAMDHNAINHRGPEFGRLGREVVSRLRQVFQTDGTVAIYPSSGTGAWEAALVNTLSPGDRVLLSHTGWFAHLWEQLVRRQGLEPVMLETDWRRGADPAAIEAALAADHQHRIKAVCAVHSETSTSCMTDIPAIRQAMDRAGHPALLMVDAISSLACADLRHDEWGIDVTVAGSQKGLMVPPGPGVQRDQRQGAGGDARRQAAARLLGLGAAGHRQQDRLLPLHAGDQPAVRAERGADDAAGGRPAERLRSARPLRRGDPPHRAPLGTGAAVPGPARLCAGRDRGPHAGRPQRRQVCAP